MNLEALAPQKILVTGSKSAVFSYIKPVLHTDQDEASGSSYASVLHRQSAYYLPIIHDTNSSYHASVVRLYELDV